MRHDVDFVQTDKWVLEDFKLILEKPSGFDIEDGEDVYFALQYKDKRIILDRNTCDDIHNLLKNLFIDLNAIKEDRLYDFDCSCAEGVPSYNRHGDGRCDGCHGRIFK